MDELYLSSKKHYARIIPVVQSSGMGKSKTGDRTARDRILFPMCLREDLGNDLFGASQGPGTQATDQVHLL